MTQIINVFLAGKYTRRFANLTLRTKLIVAFLLVSVVSVGTVTFFTNRTTSAALAEETGANLKSLANSQALAAGDLLARQVDALQSLSVSGVLRSRVNNFNAYYTGDRVTIQTKLTELDRQWATAADTDLLIQTVLKNTAATELLIFQELFPDHVEVFITDQYGALVAATNRPSDYYQADEAWWQAAYNEGQGAIYIGRPSFDESSAIFGLNIAVPLYDQDNRTVIGVLRTTYRLATLSNLVASTASGQRGLQVDLLLPEGQMLATDRSGLEPLGPDTISQLQSSAPTTYAVFSFEGVPSLVSQAPVAAITGEPVIADLNWTVVAHQDQTEAMVAVAAQQRAILLSALLIAGLAALAAVGLAHWLTRPITRLTAVARQVSEGDLQVQAPIEARDEIGHLAKTFNNMTAQLRELIGSLQQRIEERKQAEEVLQAERDKAQNYLDIAGVIIVALAADQNVALINKTGCEILEGNEEDIIGKNWFDNFVPERDRDRTKAVFGMLMAKEIEPVEYFENPILTRSGEERLVAWYNTLLTDETGKVIGTLSSGEDITKRRQAEEALRESEERYRHMFQAASVSLWEQDISELNSALDELKRQGVKDIGQYLDENPDFVQQAVQMIKVVDVNDRTLQIYGARSRDELFGSLSKTFSPEAVPDFKEEIVAIAEQKPHFEEETFALTLRGERIYILLSVSIPQASTTSNTMLVSIMDITERKQAEEALQRHTERLRILHEIDQAILAAQSPEEIVRAALGHIRQLVPCQRASVVTFDHEARQVSVLAADASSDIEPVEQPRFGFEEFGVIEELWQDKVYVMADITTSPKPPAMGQIMLEKGARSYINVPLFAQDQLIGSLNLGASTSDAFSPEYIDIACEVAGPLAVAITQARLREQIQRHTEELEQRVTDRTRELSVLYEVTAVASESLDLQTTLAQSLERVLAAMKSNAGLIHLLDEAEKTLNLAVQQGLPPDLVAQIKSLPSNKGLGRRLLEHREPLLVLDVASDSRVAEISYLESPQTYVGMPMRASGGVVGVLSILREAAHPQFNVEEVALLTSIADQIGVVVESARLRQRAEQAAVIEERARLARELHDSVTQSLYSAMLLADAGGQLAQAGDLEQAKGYMVRLGEIVQHALKEMRLLIYELRPSALEQVGLVEALRQRLEAVERRANIAISITTDELVDLPAPIEQELYQIAQEALNNALKHAQATSVTVHISTAGEQVTLEVRDNGQGFDLEAAKRGGGLGLSTMRERAEKLGGMLEVTTSLDIGTQVKIVVNC